MASDGLREILENTGEISQNLHILLRGWVELLEKGITYIESRNKICLTKNFYTLFREIILEMNPNCKMELFRKIDMIIDKLKGSLHLKSEGRVALTGILLAYIRDDIKTPEDDTQQFAKAFEQLIKIKKSRGASTNGNNHFT